MSNTIVSDLYRKDTDTIVHPNIESDNIPTGAVTTDKVADNSVTTGKLNFNINGLASDKGKLDPSNIDYSNTTTKYYYSIRLKLDMENYGWSDVAYIEFKYITTYQFTANTTDVGWFADLLESMEWGCINYIVGCVESDNNFFNTTIHNISSGTATFDITNISNTQSYTILESDILQVQKLELPIAL